MHTTYIHNLNVVNVIKTLKAINLLYTSALSKSLIAIATAAAARAHRAIKNMNGKTHQNNNNNNGSNGGGSNNEGKTNWERNTKLKFITQWLHQTWCTYFFHSVAACRMIKLKYFPSALRANHNNFVFVAWKLFHSVSTVLKGTFRWRTKKTTAT